MAALAVVTGMPAARAQMMPAGTDLFSPALDVSPGEPLRFDHGSIPAHAGSTASGQRTSDRQALPSGAGATGFDSRNLPVSQNAPGPTDSGGNLPAQRPPDSSPGDTGFRPADPPPLRMDQGASGLSKATVPSAKDPYASDTPADKPAKPVRLRRRKPVDDDHAYDPLGIRLGAFVLKPAIELSGGYNSNPAELNRPKGGAELVVSPELKVQSDWSRHEFRADLRGSYMTFPGFEAEPSIDRPSIDSKIAARVDVTRLTHIDLEGRFSLFTEDPNSPNLQAGLAKLPTGIASGATIGVRRQFNRLELGVSGSFDRTIYADSQLTDGSTVSNDDRNYDQYGVKLRGSYELLPGVKPFVEIGGDRRVHDLEVDASGLRRDSVGQAVSVGTSFELTRLLTGSVSVGYATRNYQDTALTDLSGLIADGSLVWRATPLTTMTFAARSTVDESTVPGVSGVLRRGFEVRVDHAFRLWLIGNARFGYATNDYVGSIRRDQDYAAAAGLTFNLSREVQLKGEFRHEWQTSNVPGGAYEANIVLLTVRLQR